jgi:C4-type Zn-finger protein
MDDCPNCGCNVYRVVERRAPWFGEGEIEVRQCDHCRHEWETRVAAEPEEPAATVQTERYCIVRKRLVCPHCGSRKHHVYCVKHQGDMTIRYYRCDLPGCDKTFKLIEN